MINQLYHFVSIIDNRPMKLSVCGYFYTAAIILVGGFVIEFYFELQAQIQLEKAIVVLPSTAAQVGSC